MKFTALLFLPTAAAFAPTLTRTPAFVLKDSSRPVEIKTETEIMPETDFSETVADNTINAMEAMGPEEMLAQAEEEVLKKPTEKRFDPLSLWTVHSGQF